MGSGEGGRSRGTGSGRQRAAARSAQTSRRSKPTVTATVITVIALVVVAFLGLQASRSAQTAAAVGGSPSPGPTMQTPTRAPTVPPIPANTGTGRRIVYSVGQARIWITDTTGTVIGAFGATPGFEPPTIGRVYSVSSHSRQGLGNDGRLYQYGTFFGETSDGYSLAFNTVDMTTATNRPTSLPPEPAALGGTPGWHAENSAGAAASRTAAIRVGLYEADLIYYHSPIGTKVYVVG